MLSTAAQSVFLRIYRQTWGWNKATDKIATSHFQEKCNIKSHETVKFAIDELVKLKLIKVEGRATQIKEFGIDVDELQRIRQQYIEAQEDEF
jgi:phage replication O-like protein O